MKPATDDEEALSGSGKQISNPLTSLVCGKQHAFMSEDYSLQRHLAQIYQESGETCTQTHLLELTFPRHKESKSGRQQVLNGGTEVLKRLVHQPLETVTADEQDLSAFDIFYDCVSRVSANDSPSSIDSLCANFQGSPNYYFESKPSFYPEQYSIESLFSERIFVVAMIQSQEDYRRQKYFLIYAENPRRGQRITVSATFSHVRERAAVLQVSALDKDQSCKILPKVLQSLLNQLLLRLEFFN